MTAEEFKAVMKQLRMLGYTYSTVAAALGIKNVRSLERMTHPESSRSHIPVHPDMAAKLRQMVEEGQQARMARIAEAKLDWDEKARRIVQELASGPKKKEDPAP